MPYQIALSLAELQNAERLVKIIDEKKILFIWHKEAVYAVGAQCPHLKLPLTKGKITDDLALVCPFHKSAFDLNTGEPKCWSPWPPALGPLLGKISKEKPMKIYATEVIDGQIMIEMC